MYILDPLYCSQYLTYIYIYIITSPKIETCHFPSFFTIKVWFHVFHVVFAGVASCRRGDQDHHWRRRVGCSNVCMARNTSYENPMYGIYNPIEITTKHFQLVNGHDFFGRREPPFQMLMLIVGCWEDIAMWHWILEPHITKKLDQISRFWKLLS